MLTLALTLMLAQADLDDPVKYGVTFETMTREQLFQRRLELERQKPGVVGPISMAFAGMFLFGGSAPIIIFGAAYGYYSAFVLVFIGAVVAVAGAALVTVGLILLNMALRGRAVADREIELVDRQLNLQERRMGLPPPVPAPAMTVFEF